MDYMKTINILGQPHERKKTKQNKTKQKKEKQIIFSTLWF